MEAAMKLIGREERLEKVRGGKISENGRKDREEI